MADDLTELKQLGGLRHAMRILVDPATGVPIPAASLGGGGAASADDTNEAHSTVTTNGTAGVWTELMPANAARLGAAVQNKSTTQSAFILSSATQPANGAQAGEIEVPVSPAYFKFDWVPKKRYWVRSAGVSQTMTLIVW